MAAVLRRSPLLHSTARLRRRPRRCRRPTDLRGGAHAPEAGAKSSALTALQYAAEQGQPARNGSLAACTPTATACRETICAPSTISARSPIRIRTKRRAPPQARFVANAFVGARALLSDRHSRIRRSQRILTRAREMFAYAATYFGDADAQYELGTALSRRHAERSAPGGALVPAWPRPKAIAAPKSALGDMLFQGQAVPRQAARGLMWLTLGKDCAGRDESWIKPLYDTAFQRASDDERAMALVYLEDWLKGRRGLAPATLPRYPDRSTPARGRTAFPRSARGGRCRRR